MRERSFLFTDIEGSSRLWERYPKEMSEALQIHDRLVERGVAEHSGKVFKTVGDAFCAAFFSPLEAVAAAEQIQKDLLSQKWPTPDPISVRMALHVGEVDERNGDFFGPPLNRLARIVDLGNGGQILCSERISALIPERVTFLETVALRGLDVAERVFQVNHSESSLEFPPLRINRTLNRAGNIPSPVSTLVGREKELEQLGSLLQSNRMVTLTGPGGIGKTRVALAYCQDLTRNTGTKPYAGGVWLLELTKIADPDNIARNLVRTLGLSVRNTEEPLRVLVNELRPLRALLLLDNCEHVVAEVAELSDCLLRSCPNIQILATSREPLGIEGEQVLRMAPMAIPRVGAPYQEVLESESVRLFLQMGSAVNANFTINQEDLGPLVEVCRMLEGIPLAIRLAASRMQTIPLSQLTTRLQDRFSLLKGGSRTGDPRHQTLRAVFDWSYSLLDEEGKRAFATCSVFRGGWTIEAAAAVMVRGLGPTEELLHDLVGKSLVEVNRDGRFSMLETTREYAHEKLISSGEVIRIQHRHAEYFAGFAQQSLVGFRGTNQLEWRQRVSMERDNVAAALRCPTTSQEDLRPVFTLASVMWRWWYVNAEYDEGIEHLKRLIPLSDGSFAELETRMKRGAAWLTYLIGDIREGEAYAESALESAIASGSHSELALTYGLLGSVLAWKGDYEGALERYMRELAVHEAADDEVNRVRVLHRIGDNLHHSGKTEESLQWFEQALPLFKKLGDRLGMAWCLHSLSEACFTLGRLSEASRLAADAVEIREQVGDPRGLAHSLLLRSKIMHAIGETDEAKQLLNRGVALAKVVQDRSAFPYALAILASFASQDSPRLATRLLAQAYSIRTQISMPLIVPAQNEVNQLVSLLKQKLGEDAYAEEYRNGYSEPEIDFSPQ